VTVVGGVRVRCWLQWFERFGGGGASDVRLLAQIHDELIIECPAASAAEVARHTKGIMEGVRLLAVPLVATVESGVAWGSLTKLAL